MYFSSIVTSISLASSRGVDISPGPFNSRQVGCLPEPMSLSSRALHGEDIVVNSHRERQHDSLGFVSDPYGYISS
ncbi:hypothetical protein BDZ94DRAFT_1273380, partial [Collybia nuda]